MWGGFGGFGCLGGFSLLPEFSWGLLVVADWLDFGVGQKNMCFPVFFV